jgi:hypothetical protein
MISAIILNWNGKRHLKECLESLGNQTYRDFETIFVDNGSSDGSVRYVRENFPDVRILALSKNTGFSKGNNEGIKIAKGEYIALLNNDTRVDRYWLEELYGSICKHPEISFFASKIIYYDETEKIDSAGDGYAICGAPFKIGHYENRSKYSQEKIVFGACAGASLYKKEMLNDIGLLDDDFFAIYEDGDLNFRAQLRGYKCLFVPSAIVYHKGSSSIGTLSDFYVYYGQRNVEYVYIKNMPFLLILKNGYIHFFYNLLAFVYFLIKGKTIKFIQAKIDVLRNLSNLLKKRLEIQKNRKINNYYLLSLFEKRWLTTRIKGKL